MEHQNSDLPATPQPDSFADEQRHLSYVYSLAESERADTVRKLRKVMAESGGTPQARSERESYNALFTSQIRQIDEAQAGLCFGRIDMTPETVEASKGAGDGSEKRPEVTRYIGRLGLLDDTSYQPVLVDWRAPLARPYYLATTAQPENVWRRRTLRSVGSKLTDYSDEFLTPGPTPPGYPEPTQEASGVASESALLQALNAPRTGHMSDIVATIQREQDMIIRCDHRGVVVVEGGPGTGKTAVALHRAAYLLYTYRSVLERAGVLIVGPNEHFLDYINQVLPSLGETGVVLSTLGNIFPGVSTSKEDTLAAQEIKGHIHMVDVIKAAIRDWQTLLEKDVYIRVDGTPFAVTPPMLRRARGRARSSRRAHNRARQIFHDKLTQEIVDAYAEEIGSDPNNPSAKGALLSRSDIADLTEEVLRSPEVHALVDEHWPLLDAVTVVDRLLTDSDHLLRASKKLLSAEDAERILRKPESEFTTADVPLLDEAAEQLGPQPRDRSAEDDENNWHQMVEDAQDALDILQASASMEFEDESDTEILAAYDIIDAKRLAQRHRIHEFSTTAERAAKDRKWTYGHVIVDEAQELSPMAWRLLMRRTGNRWMTIVGDTAQTSNPAGVNDWETTLSPYVKDRWRHFTLTVNYRTPEEIMDAAEKVLKAIDPDSTVPQSIRRSGHPVQLHDRHDKDWSTAIQETLHRIAEAEDAAGRMTGVICSHRAFSELSQLDLDCPGCPTPQVSQVSDIKGLEFDYVMIVDPVGITEESPQGLNDLYVALTRATQAAVIIHEGEIPACLAPLL